MPTKIQTRSELVAEIARLRSKKERLEDTLEEIGKLVAEELDGEDEDTGCDFEEEEEEDEDEDE